MSRLRVAVAGVNHWHSLFDAAYLRHLAAMPEAEIVGIQDDDAGIAADRVQAIGGGVLVFARLQEMLARARPDFVLALDRHDRMAAIGAVLADAGLPFMMEKPLGFDSRQVRGLYDRVAAAGLFASVPLLLRHSPLVVHARRLVEDGSLGPLGHFYARLNRPSSARYPLWGSAWMLDPKISNGGCLRNLGPHCLDCFAFLTGEDEDIAVTGAQLSWSTHGQPVEDYASVLLRSGRGVLGTVEVGNVFPADGRDAELKVAFRDGILKTEGDAVRLYTAEGAETLPSPGASPSILERTLGAFLRGENPPAGISAGYHAVRLVDLAYLAAGNPYGTAAV